MNNDLENRIKYLENRLALQDLRHRYWLSIVEKDLETMVSCYAREAESHFTFGIKLQGIDSVREFYAGLFSNEDLIVQVPRGGNDVIEFVDDKNAKGSWLVDVVLRRKSMDVGIRTGVRYHERYTFEDGQWRICYQETINLYWETMTLREAD